MVAVDGVGGVGEEQVRARNRCCVARGTGVGEGQVWAEEWVWAVGSSVGSSLSASDLRPCVRRYALCGRDGSRCGTGENPNVDIACACFSSMHRARTSHLEERHEQASRQ